MSSWICLQLLHFQLSHQWSQSLTESHSIRTAQFWPQLFGDKSLEFPCGTVLWWSPWCSLEDWLLDSQHTIDIVQPKLECQMVLMPEILTTPKLMQMSSTSNLNPKPNTWLTSLQHLSSCNFSTWSTAERSVEKTSTSLSPSSTTGCSLECSSLLLLFNTSVLPTSQAFLELRSSPEENGELALW